MIKKVEIKRNISKAELLWEQLWRQWRDGKIITPLDELLTYTSIVQDGGHIRLFITLQCKEKVLLFIKGLKGMLPNKLYKNLKKAYSIFCSNENEIINCKNTSHLEELFEKQDLYFYDYQYLIHKVILYYLLDLTIDKEYKNKLINI